MLMISYRLLYQLISKLPDWLVEVSGGIFYKIYIRYHNIPHVKLPYELINHEIMNPVGLSSGWADTPEKMEIIHKMGAGVVISKTITLNPRRGNPYPRIIRYENFLVNSMGLPNKGANWWSEKLDKKWENTRILSIHGDTISEWIKLIELLDNKTDIFELNFSCPNVGNGIIDIKTAASLIKDITSVCNSPIFIKLSPEFKAEDNLQFVTKIEELINGVSLINTLPTMNNKLGNPTKHGGISGKYIYSKLVNQLIIFRERYPTMKDMPILASGGIIDPITAWEILSDYKSLPLGLTGFLINGPYYFYNNAKFIQEEMDLLGYNTISEIINE